MLAIIAVWSSLQVIRGRVIDGQTPDAGRQPAESIRIDPNTASWPELALLPGLGEHLARQIIVYREAQESEVVFCSAKDLTGVHRIGPITAAKLLPYLQFPSACGER